MKKRKNWLVVLDFVLVTLVAGCQRGTPAPAATPVATPTPVVVKETVVVEKVVTATPEAAVGQLERSMAFQVYWKGQIQPEPGLSGDTWGWIMPEAVHADSRANGGVLDVVADRAVVCRFESAINSVITVDGKIYRSGNWQWGQNDIRLSAGQHLVFNLGPAPNQGAAVWCKLAEVSVAPVVPTAKPTAVPTVAPSIQGAWGSCTWDGVQHDMKWDSTKQRLWMPFYDEGKSANATRAIPCHVRAAQPGILEALGKEIQMKAGEDWYYTFPQNDPSFGFAWRLDSGVSSAAPTASAPAVVTPPGP